MDQLLTSMHAVIVDPSFYAGIVVGVCAVLSIIIVATRISHDKGWRYVKEDQNAG